MAKIWITGINLRMTKLEAPWVAPERTAIKTKVKIRDEKKKDRQRVQSRTKHDHTKTANDSRGV
jgi:hypothetical protein